MDLPIMPKLTDKAVAALKPGPKSTTVPDPQLTGHYVRLQPGGQKTFITIARNPAGKQVWTTIGATDVLSIDESREQAREVLKRVRAGEAAFETPPDSFADVAARWLKRHGEAKRLRSLTQIKRLLNTHVLPEWGDRPFLGIRRSDVAALLDGIEDRHGARQADLVLTIVRSIMNWCATRRDDYNPPIVKGMRRQNPKETERERVLTDDELRLIWKLAEGSGRFGSIIMLGLLTAQRRTKIATMKWTDLSADGSEWTVPKEPREKDTGGVLLLPERARAIIAAQPRLADDDHVFAGRSGDGFSGFSASKVTFDRKLPDDMEPWTLHDLRRTARSLLARAGVAPHIAERVLGHAIGGVEGIYDRHRYEREKADALRKLAALIDSIVNERANVVPIQRKR
jgi:integrase